MLIVVVALVHSWLNYGNVVLIGIPAYLVCHLQSVLNAAARLSYHLRLHDHISDALETLHWLRVSECMQYEIAVLTFKVRAAIFGTSCRHRWPAWLASSAVSKYQLPSCASHQTVYCCSHAFPVATAQVWNGLPEAVISSSSLQTFHLHLNSSFSTFIPSPDLLIVWLASLQWSL